MPPEAMQGMDADMMAMMPPEAMQGMADMMAAMPPEAMQGMDADMMAAMPPGVAPPPGPEGMAPPADAGGMGDMDALGAALARKVLSQWLDLIQWELIHLLDPKVIQWLIWHLPIQWELIHPRTEGDPMAGLDAALEELWIKLWTKALVGVPRYRSATRRGRRNSSRCSRHCPEPAAGPDEPIVG